MAERLVKLKFLGTPYLVTIDTRSFTLKKAKSWDDKFPTPLGYHRSVFTMCDTLMKQGFQQVKGDLTVKTFVKKIKELWDDEVQPFLNQCVEQQKALQQEMVNEQSLGKDYKKLAELVRDGKLQQAKTLAEKLKG